MADEVETEYKYLNGRGLKKLWSLIAPKNHASASTEYGAASTTNYGHVLITDAIAGDDTTNAIVPRQSAVAPKNHASSATTYGVASSSNYGHVKITDSATTKDSQTAASTKLLNDLFKFQYVNSYNVTSASPALESGTINVAMNTSKTLFKVYGYYSYKSNKTRVAIPGMSGWYGVKINLSNKITTSTAYRISAGYVIGITSGALVAGAGTTTFAIGTDGNLYLRASTAAALTVFPNAVADQVYLPPCLYINSNFGD